MMGCFPTSKSEKQRSSTVHTRISTNTVVASKDSLSLLSNKPVLLPDPDHLFGRQSFASESAGRTKARGRFYQEEELMLAASGLSNSTSSTDHIIPPSSKIRIHNRAAKPRTSFSAPLVSSATHNEGLSRLQQELPYELVVASDVEGGKTKALRTLRRAASFGGRPQPLPLPVAEDDVLPKTKSKLQPMYNLQPLPSPKDAYYTSAVPTTSHFATRSRTRSTCELEAAGRVKPEGGLPLPPPSLATNLLPSLAAFEFRQLALATDDFAAACCVSKSASGDVFRARVEDLSGAKSPHAKLEVAVLRLPENTQQVSLGNISLPRYIKFESMYMYSSCDHRNDFCVGFEIFPGRHGMEIRGAAACTDFESDRLCRQGVLCSRGSWLSVESESEKARASRGV